MQLQLLTPLHLLQSNSSFIGIKKATRHRVAFFYSCARQGAWRASAIESAMVADL
jgi:hypothetical protein